MTKAPVRKPAIKGHPEEQKASLNAFRDLHRLRRYIQQIARQHPLCPPGEA